jgi:hypothetical protein
MSNLVLVHFETVLVSVQDRSRFTPNIPLAQKLFWAHPMVPLGDRAQVEAFLVCLEIVLILMQYRCSVYAKCTIVSEIIMDTLLGDVGHVESHFGPFGNGVSIGAR